MLVELLVTQIKNCYNTATIKGGFTYQKDSIIHKFIWSHTWVGGYRDYNSTHIFNIFHYKNLYTQQICGSGTNNDNITGCFYNGGISYNGKTSDEYKKIIVRRASSAVEDKEFEAGKGGSFVDNFEYKNMMANTDGTDSNAIVRFTGIYAKDDEQVKITQGFAPDPNGNGLAWYWSSVVVDTTDSKGYGQWVIFDTKVNVKSLSGTEKSAITASDMGTSYWKSDSVINDKLPYLKNMYW